MVTDRDASEGGLSASERQDAAAGDLNILAALMLFGSTVFALVNRWIDTMGWLAVALTIASTATWSIGLFRRAPVIAAFVKIGFGFSGLAAPIVGLGGLALGLFGFGWGWVLLAGAALYFALSVLGLEIIARAEEAGVLDPLAE